MILFLTRLSDLRGCAFKVQKSFEQGSPACVPIKGRWERLLWSVPLI
ncbi:hypothetical protein A4W95_00164 [Treponema pallidum subsp. pallidum]|nr:conserved hypothetical protein [Treponema pallidum subsp. pallidum str. Chicago]ANA42003.1 hypothetical protein A4W95_00164 [Treponema pallidum subsp. pallidum]